MKSIINPKYIVTLASYIPSKLDFSPGECPWVGLPPTHCFRFVAVDEEEPNCQGIGGKRSFDVIQALCMPLEVEKGGGDGHSCLIDLVSWKALLI